MNLFARRRPENIRRTCSASGASAPSQTNSLTPITAHYSLNTTLKKAFYKLRESCQYSTALAVGMQFCRIALWDIPQHGYYDSPKYNNFKAQNAEDAVLIADLTVIEILPQVLSYAQLNKTKAKISMSDLEGHLQEAKMLREEAHNNAKLVISERSKNATNTNYSQGSRMMTAEDIDHNLDSSPSWANACGACGTLMCVSAKDIVWPTSNPMNEVKENNVEERSNNIEYSKENIHSAATDREMIPTSSISEGYKAQYQHAAVNFERSTSAPPILWQKKTRNESINLTKRYIPTVEEESITSLAPYLSSPNVLDNDDQHSVAHHNNERVSEQVQFQSDLDRALYLSSLELQRYSRQESSSSLLKYSTPNVSYDSNSEIASIALKHQDSFHKMGQDQRIQVEFLNTYQGRIRESTNGCTVIAPLMAIHHVCNMESLKTRNPILMKIDVNYSHDLNYTAEYESDGTSTSLDDIGINNDTITAVIDIQAPLVVPKVREHLGLHRDALIVPSDAHDYLIDDNFLHQTQFVGVHGGNILDSNHLGTFLRDFSECGLDDEDWKRKNEGGIKKAAATLYFHEHVICIHRLMATSCGNDALLHGNTTKQSKKVLLRKIRNIGKKKRKEKELSTRCGGKEEVIFDVIDSLPSPSTLSSQKKRNGSTGWLQQTARIRCIGRNSLQTYLTWYACSKFSQEDKMFIDSYQFDANNVDLDPRVFQTFIWSE